MGWVSNSGSWLDKPGSRTFGPHRKHALVTRKATGSAPETSTLPKKKLDTDVNVGTKSLHLISV